MKTILLKLSGPMQSWGSDSHFNQRYTHYHPSKSAIVGIMAASLGYRKSDDRIKELNEVDFAVRVDQKPKILKDFHIAKNKKDKKKVYLTERYYLEDGVFTIALSSKDDGFITEIYNALKSPYFQPYMGRKSCPIPADFIIDFVDKDPITAIKEVKWQACESYKLKNVIFNTKIYGDYHLIRNKKKIKNDKVISFSQENIVYGLRPEGEMTINLSNTNKTDHDPMAVL